jgi:16S rRNA pseudouridine516 synthase
MGGELVLTEGKYHQVKRMLAAVGNRILTLERVRFGPLVLDPMLARGAWRYLSAEETAALTSAAADTHRA